MHKRFWRDKAGITIFFGYTMCWLCGGISIKFVTLSAKEANAHIIIYNMTQEQKLAIEEKVVEMLRTVFDPEIPVDIYSLGLIYKIDVTDAGEINIDMTLTAPNCPAADFIIEDARLKLEAIEGVTGVNINIVFEPEWDKEMMSDEAKLELGFM
jgi:FeS assembly SUF system protein